jgi:hypothetical protein
VECRKLFYDILVQDIDLLWQGILYSCPCHSHLCLGVLSSELSQDPNALSLWLPTYRSGWALY